MSFLLITFFLLVIATTTYVDAELFAAPCTSTTECSAYGSFEGGTGRCAYNLCLCLVFPHPCSSDTHCCSKSCSGGICAKGNPTDPCRGDAAAGQTCAEGSNCVAAGEGEIVPIAKQEWGLCQ